MIQVESRPVFHGEEIARLDAALQRLEAAARPLGLPPLAGREWYELLTRKLIPQTGDGSFLVVAVVGGTNIGKSVVFNHVAGIKASATSPLASGTRHPTCLAPTGFSREHAAADIFPDFAITPWTTPEAALVEDGVDRLFWRESGDTPANLLILDTPDVDSDARVNWARADHIRQSADVLLAVLTQQKYNDAAVKEFFRKAAAEDKVVLLVFNQLLLPEDEVYWPLWGETFCRETGVRPEAIFIAPNDRRAAEENRLPFYERTLPVTGAKAPPAGRSVGSGQTAGVGGDRRSLLEELSQLKFQDIKWRTLRGSLAYLLDDHRGAPSYLAELRRRCGEFGGAADLLAAHRFARIDAWPTAPAGALAAEIRNWWGRQRQGWTRHLHGAYNAVGAGIAWPVQRLRTMMSGPPVPPLESYRQQEWSAVLQAVELVYDRLSWLSDAGNSLLSPMLRDVVSGNSRAETLRRLHDEHRDLDLAAELQQLVDRELSTFRDDAPGYYNWFRRLDSLAAAARPATSVVLFFAGFGPFGHAVAPVLGDAAMQGIVHFAGDVAGGAAAAVVGDTVLSSGAGAGLGWLEARFRRLQQQFTQQRAEWLALRLQNCVLGRLPQELVAAASLAEGPEIQEAAGRLDDLRRLYQRIEQRG